MRLIELLHPLQMLSLTVVSTRVLAGSSAMLASSHVTAFVPTVLWPAEPCSLC